MEPSTSEIKAEIRRFLSQEIIFSSNLPPGYGDEDELIGSGIIDSLGLITLITFLEEKFSILIENRDLSERNFRSVSDMAEFVLSKR